ncbi:hypothetical protein FRUB_10491 [Fimbriiglobus ruber]|uniref:Uncharacterized protein n=2 Tax=Fimbriiglobus ruber TaxID=1908690 RepID=A0A225CYR3_9BACT|nr:hypothetical protein FRUB_10491 [Fimbriiglobus ruber]
MVFAVRCPSGRCRKYMLVEETDRGRAIPCLICKFPIQIPPVKSSAPQPAPAPPPPPVQAADQIPPTPLAIPLPVPPPAPLAVPIPSPPAIPVLLPVAEKLAPGPGGDDLIFLDDEVLGLE